VNTRETRSPYDALSIESNASANEIKRAFRALAKTKHPDVTADDGAAFRLVVSAYDVLSDDVLRLDLANGEIVRHGEFTWRLGDGDVAKTRATKWTYDDSETFVRWTKPRRARAPRVEGLTLAPSDRDERVRKWRLSQFVSLWCVVERTRDGFDLESSASARSSPERRFGSVRFVSFRFVSFRFGFTLVSLVHGRRTGQSGVARGALFSPPSFPRRSPSSFSLARTRPRSTSLRRSSRSSRVDGAENVERFVGDSPAL